MKPWRLGLSLVYVLALALVQVHDPRHGQNRSEEHAPSSCTERKPHVDALNLADQPDSGDSCPVCQFRAQHSVGDEPSALFSELRVAAQAALNPPLALPGSSLRPSCRAPPRV